jgi:aspartate racemase
MKKKTIGILGGMGPEATVFMFNLIVSLTKAEKDQEHIPILIYNNPKTPDRTAFFNNNGISPLNELVSGAQLLEKSGADFVIMPCNTAHYFYKDIIQSINIPFINMIEETAKYASEKLSGMRSFGLLSTTGTYSTRLYESYFEKYSLYITVPDNKYKEKVMQAITGKQGIKAGYKKEPLRILLEVIDHLKSKDARGIINGCTEISLVINEKHLDLPLLKPMHVLAEKAIKFAGYELK